ncbi:MAG: M81 family metallopeptidase [Meiothermus sp.]|nr:M81 family metallopeptidase [Meiothermus sp.]
MRVFIGGLGTETNTFSPIPTGLADFRVVRPADLAERGWAALEGVLYGQSLRVYAEQARQRGFEVVFGLYAFAEPAGLTARAAYEALRDELLAALEAAGPVEMVLLTLHGAMVAEGYDDCETDLLKRVRSRVGPECKVGALLDPHCDLTPALVEAADALVLFKEYPHTDVNDRAAELFHLVADAALGRTRPALALFDCRMVGGTYRTPHEPMRSFVDWMRALEGREGVLSVSLAHGFGWADVPSNGIYALAICDKDPAQAARVAEAVGRRFYRLRRHSSPRMPGLSEALEQALSAPYRGQPVVLADSADNPGAGAPGDATFVLRELLARGVENAGLAPLWDPVAVHLAMAAGPGAELNLRLGGKLGPASGDPLDLRVRVLGVQPGLVQHWPQREGTMPVDCGDAVCLECGGVRVVVISRRTQALGRELFTAFGLEPATFRLLVLKSTQHFYAAYGPLAAQVIYMDGPGAVPEDITQLPYTRVDKTKYPWVEDPLEEE